MSSSSLSPPPRRVLATHRHRGHRGHGDRSSRALLAALLLLGAAGAARVPTPPSAHSAGEASELVAALRPATTGGLAVLDRALARLGQHRRLLVVGAHPDDEDTSLLAWVARGEGGDAAYLSLSRGEGGQNLLGPELGVGLGLLRTQELLAARSIDGARQYFARAYDFGFSRSVEETLARWPEPVLLEDTVRVIRRFKPQVVVSVFPNSPDAGHGQHHASGRVTPKAYALAADATAFPELAGEGLAPWRPQALYRSTGFAPEATTLRVPLDALDPLDGRSIFQLAMASRSSHRSQDMGRLEALGRRDTSLGWLAGGEGVGSAVPFAGIDTRVQAIAELLAAGPARDAVWAELAAVEALARRTRDELSPAELERAVAPLAVIVAHLRRAAVAAGGHGDAGRRRQVEELIGEKIELAEQALAAAAGIALDATITAETVVPGERFEVEVELWNAGRALVEVRALTLLTEPGWSVAAAAPKPREGEASASPPALPLALAADELLARGFSVAVPAGARPTAPTFLERPLAGALYDWSALPPAERGMPLPPEPLRLRAELVVDGTAIELERPVVHRHRDQARGEVRRPLRVVPLLEVAAIPELVLWRLNAPAPPAPLVLRLRSHAKTPLRGTLEAASGAWKGAAAAPPFELAPGDEMVTSLPWPDAANPPAGRHEVAVSARVTGQLAGGGRFAAAYPVLDYPHVPPVPLPMPAVATVSAFELELPPLGKVGYVRGAADRIPETLVRLGVEVVLLDGEDLAEMDLAALDVIVIGPRAYESDPRLAAANPRLLAYVRRGGVAIVQYQQYDFFEKALAPYPLTLARPHGRVTDESAPVRLPVPDHPVFTRPNRIGPADWEGWAQERGLYFADRFDPAYTPLLALADPGEPELLGGLLIARAGEGTWVYTGLAFFRQLPAGVPGALRLFVNLLALGAGDGA